VLAVANRVEHNVEVEDGEEADEQAEEHEAVAEEVGVAAARSALREEPARQHGKEAELEGEAHGPQVNVAVLLEEVADQEHVLRARNKDKEMNERQD